MKASKDFILGGIRSGKSRLAERLAADSGLPVTYLATAVAGDAEMAARIATHRQQRDRSWKLIEEPVALADTLRLHGAPDRCVLVDCLTLWLTHLLCEHPHRLEAQCDALLATLPSLTGRVILVANETNLGVIPDSALARRFCDLAGRLHQDVAARCERVIFTVAGLPHVLKGEPL